MLMLYIYIYIYVCVCIYTHIVILEGSCVLGYDAMSTGKVTDIWEAIPPPFSGTMYTSATVYKLAQHHTPEGLYHCKYSSSPLLKPQISCLFDI